MYMYIKGIIALQNLIGFKFGEVENRTIESYNHDRYDVFF